MTEDERLDEKNAALKLKLDAMTAEAEARPDGRPVYPTTPEEYEAKIRASNDALYERLNPPPPAPIKVKAGKKNG